MLAPSSDTVARVVAQTPGAHIVPTRLPSGETVDLPWVPYGEGFEIPLWFEYTGGGPLNWILFAMVIDGRPQCVEFVCRGNAEQPITPELLHGFQLGRFLKEATLMVSRPADEVPREYRAWRDAKELEAARRAVLLELHKRPTASGPRMLTDDFLQEVAQVYRQNVATGKPSKAVATHFKYRSDESARRVVREARRRGFLGGARPGRAGEEVDDD